LGNVFLEPYLLTTSMEWSVISMLTNMLKYSVMSVVIISLSKISMEMRGLFSTSRGS